ncbi:helix-turn-helix transcriptional regulator [Yinghuangia seranimata]|uniref:helix-turn-helix transcriptional regulator n=1 Tax=Yinghuangia seranimata TaxID=408067 RepID=UPI00248BEE0F|nr:helix-turn-helix transcriptional regulator [Yinghuangia seranimata]MDI2127152.1 helix-turn-helix transcriptional regulator [Yinghuangia seranimata]
MNTRSTAVRKDSLRCLLKSCREAISYEEVGLARPLFGRCPGLSQEAAARLAGVSAHWWSDLENGRLRTPHPALLDAVATALRMSEQQRADLYFLATGHPPTVPGSPPVAEDGDIDLVLRTDPNPAVVTDHVGNVLAGNTAAAHWFPGLTDAPACAEANVVLWFFGATAAERVANLGEIRALWVGDLKSTVLRYPGNHAVTALVERLVQLPDAAQLWQTEYATTHHTAVRILVRHPSYGPCELTCITSEFVTGKRLHVGYPSIGLK